MKIFNLEEMKRILTVIILLTGMNTAWVSAQNDNMERLNAYRIAFFTKKLNLSTQEAEKFWPLYNDYQNQKNSLQIEKNSLLRLFNLGEATLSDKEVTELGDKYCAALVKESELAVDLHKKLQGILPPKKVIKVYQAENQYRVQLLNELQDRRQGAGGARINQIPE
jgi:hypothetical protein